MNWVNWKNASTLTLIVGRAEAKELFMVPPDIMGVEARVGWSEKLEEHLTTRRSHFKSVM